MFGMFDRLIDAINYAQFHLDQLRRFGFVGSEKCMFTFENQIVFTTV